MVFTKEELVKFCHEIPKVELHCHLYGTIRRSTLESLNDRQGNPCTDAEVEDFYTRGDKPVGILRVFRALDEKLMRYPEDLYRLTSEYLEDARSHNVLYTEFFWNPSGAVLVSGIPYKEAQDAIVKAIGDMEKSLGIKSKLICCIDRESPVEHSVKVVDWMIRYRDPNVIGLGIDYRETNRPPELFAEAYQKAKSHGFKLTAHAGEYGTPWNNVDYVVNTLKVDRIDHGYTVIDNPELVQQCLKQGITFTVVPTNSFYLRTLEPEKWAQKHPIKKMVELGLKVHPNSDDPTLHFSDPTIAWTMMADSFGCTISDLKQFSMNGLDGAWIDDVQRKAWKEEWGKVFDNYTRV